VTDRQTDRRTDRQRSLKQYVSPFHTPQHVHTLRNSTVSVPVVRLQETSSPFGCVFGISVVWFIIPSAEYVITCLTASGKKSLRMYTISRRNMADANGFFHQSWLNNYNYLQWKDNQWNLKVTSLRNAPVDLELPVRVNAKKYYKLKFPFFIKTSVLRKILRIIEWENSFLFKFSITA